MNKNTTTSTNENNAAERNVPFEYEMHTKNGLRPGSGILFYSER